MVPNVPHLLFYAEHPEKMWPGDLDRLTDWTNGVSREKDEWLESFAQQVFMAGPIGRS